MPGFWSASPPGASATPPTSRSIAPHEDAPGDGSGALWLDITGCAHLFGGEAALRLDLLERLGRRGLHARAAIADSPGAAWALARFGADDAAIVQPGGSRAALGPLPVAALRLASEQTLMLERLGLARIESLYPLPRQALAARFGDDLSKRLDQALGAAAEPISPRTPSARASRPAGVRRADPAARGPAARDPQAAATALLRPRGGRVPGRGGWSLPSIGSTTAPRASRSAPAGRAAIPASSPACSRRSWTGSIRASASSARSSRQTWSSRCCRSRSPGARWGLAISTRRATWRPWSTA